MMRVLRNSCQLKLKRGMTLIEMMIAVAILAVVLLGAGAVLFHSRQMAEDARLKLIALDAAKNTLEVIKNTPLANCGAINTGGLVSEDLPDGAIAISTNPANLANQTLATITVTVSWTGANNRTSQFQSSTMKSSY